MTHADLWDMLNAYAEAQIVIRRCSFLAIASDPYSVDAVVLLSHAADATTKQAMTDIFAGFAMDVAEELERR